jgi:hypothetical protein
MHRSKTEHIFELGREDLIKDLQISSNPLAVLPGGQPASGKSRLVAVAQGEHMNETFLKVNGDKYRIYHRLRSGYNVHS